jgi:hypothetical protein
MGEMFDIAYQALFCSSSSFLDSGSAGAADFLSNLMSVTLVFAELKNLIVLLDSSNFSLSSRNLGILSAKDSGVSFRSKLTRSEDEPNKRQKACCSPSRGVHWVILPPHWTK